MVSNFFIINVGLDLSGILLCIIGMIGVVICRKIMRRDTRIFIAMFCANCLTLLSNMLGLLYRGNMSAFASKALPVFNFCEFAFSYTMVFLVSIYIIETVNVKRPLTEFKGGAFCLYIIAMSMLILSQFNHMYYIIDESNVYHRQTFYWIAQMFGIIFMLYDLIIITAYPAVTFDNKKIKCTGLIIAVAILVAGTIFATATGHDFYSTDILASSESGEAYFDDSYAVALADETYGKVSIVYNEAMGAYTVHAEFKKPGKTELILTSPDGKKTVYDLTVAKNSFDLDPVKPSNPK